MPPAGRHGDGANLSRPWGEDRRAGRPVRQLRHRRPPPGGPADPAARPDRGGGESPRRRRHHRHPGGRDRGARRLHAADRRARQHDLQRRSVQEAAVRSARRFHSGRDRLQHLLHHGRLEEPALLHPEGDHRGGAQESRWPESRPRGHRQRTAHLQCRVPEAHRNEVPRSLLSRLGCRLPRHPGRPRRPVRRFDARGAALCQGRAGEGPRGSGAHAPPADARRADHDGSRRARPRDRTRGSACSRRPGRRLRSLPACSRRSRRRCRSSSPASRPAAAKPWRSRPTSSTASCAPSTTAGSR